MQYLNMQRMMAARLMSCTLFPDPSLPFSDLRSTRRGGCDLHHISRQR
jgi:hypothetical protein